MISVWALPNISWDLFFMAIVFVWFPGLYYQWVIFSSILDAPNQKDVVWTHACIGTIQVDILDHIIQLTDSVFFARIFCQNLTCSKCTILICMDHPLFSIQKVQKEVKLGASFCYLRSKMDFNFFKKIFWQWK